MAKSTVCNMFTNLSICLMIYSRASLNGVSVINTAQQPFPQTYQSALNKVLVHICNNNVGNIPVDPPMEIIEDQEALWGILGVAQRPDITITGYLGGIKQHLVLSKRARFRDKAFILVWIYIQRIVNIEDYVEIDYLTVHKLLALSSWITFKMDMDTNKINCKRYSDNAFGMEAKELMEYESIILRKLDFDLFVDHSEFEKARIELLAFSLEHHLEDELEDNMGDEMEDGIPELVLSSPVVPNSVSPDKPWAAQSGESRGSTLYQHALATPNDDGLSQSFPTAVSAVSGPSVELMDPPVPRPQSRALIAALRLGNLCNAFEQEDLEEDIFPDVSDEVNDRQQSASSKPPLQRRRSSSQPVTAEEVMRQTIRDLSQRA